MTVFLFNHSDKSEVESLINITETTIPLPKNNNQFIDSVTVSSKQAELIYDISNDNNIFECESEPFIKDGSYFEIQQQYFQSLSNSASQDKLLEYVLFSKLPESKSRLDC